MDRIIEQAKRDAKLFTEEFPRESIGSSDWDAEAFANLPASSRTSEAWEVYRTALHAEVERLTLSPAPRS